MSKFIAALSFFILAATASPPSAAAEGKIAVVNLQRAIFTTKTAEKRMNKLKRRGDYKRQRERIEKLQENGRKALSKFKKDEATMSESAKKKALRRLETLRADAEYEIRKIQALEQEVLEELHQELLPRAKEILTELIEREGIGLLLSDGPQNSVVLHADTGFDITAKVSDRLNRD